MTKQILAFLFCFTRELNPHSPLMSILPPTHPPIPHTLTLRALSLWLNRVKDSTNPLLPPYIHPYPHPPPTHGVKIWGNKFHYNKNIVTTKQTQPEYLLLIKGVVASPSAQARSKASYLLLPGVWGPFLITGVRLLTRGVSVLFEPREVLIAKGWNWFQNIAIISVIPDMVKAIISGITNTPQTTYRIAQ